MDSPGSPAEEERFDEGWGGSRCEEGVAPCEAGVTSGEDKAPSPRNREDELPRPEDEDLEFVELTAAGRPPTDWVAATMPS